MASNSGERGPDPEQQVRRAQLRADKKRVQEDRQRAEQPGPAEGLREVHGGAGTEGGDIEHAEGLPRAPDLQPHADLAHRREREPHEEHAGVMLHQPLPLQ